ncbi:D-glycero-beta-D-manno-heptose 1-phosphate adenylyltransferase [Cupriavidus campinensis]|uniref:D-glycero-beta-D-manno-heptose 1-phosphate adenylyltransferase n=1 Tax=Cupriavidus campinensis TaxID=151783 RepID=A0ABY3EFU5_9BURK|nr:D-glycero-beta-D-manno-heptose 1-phosphate adenylyltransferase [Cupriavidus campinensis]TSP09693.1 D-glycero-beta-D-manno-heptose 1-phosphate adenylyltransferase [Cupriavidus campinensis]
MTAPAFESKLVPADDAAALRAAVAALPRPLVFTNGVFDIMHRGHATYLAQARELGAALIVGVNSDSSVKMLGKGDDRPLNHESDRMALLAALASVDLVAMFREKTPVELIRLVRPDIYVKGGDYDIDTLEETRLVRSWGGQAYAIPFLHDRSTTKLLTKVRQQG